MRRLNTGIISEQVAEQEVNRWLLAEGHGHLVESPADKFAEMARPRLAAANQTLEVLSGKPGGPRKLASDYTGRVCFCSVFPDETVKGHRCLCNVDEYEENMLTTVEHALEN